VNKTYFLVLFVAVGVVRFFIAVLRLFTFSDLVLAFQRFALISTDDA